MRDIFLNSSSIPAGNTSRSATQKLKDGVDNNDYKFDEGQSGSLVAGKNFGIVTNIVTGPDGSLFVTSLTRGAVYMIR